MKFLLFPTKWSDQGPIVSPTAVVTPKIVLFLVIWLVLAVVAIRAEWCDSRRDGVSKSYVVFVSFVILFSIPALFSGVWLFSAPYIHNGSLNIFTRCSLFPLCFIIVWKLALRNLVSKFTRAELIMPIPSILVALVLLELASSFFLKEEYLRQSSAVKRSLAVSSPDRSYWYISKKLAKDGTNQANSFGFIGPDPEVTNCENRILLIGDSMPGPGIPVNFPKVAETLYNSQQSDPKKSIQIMNASFPGYSLEQIKLYYKEKLEALPHNLLVLSFYIDDVNRELSYRKKNLLFNPAWPEWMQDFYHGVFLWRKILNIVDFSDKTFLYYRKRTREGALPAAINILDEIRIIAEKRGAKLLIINVPYLNWSGALSEINQYEFSEANRLIEKWCGQRDIPYNDLLLPLLGKDIEKFRKSPSNYHFNEVGHRLIGAELMKFLMPLI